MKRLAPRVLLAAALMGLSAFLLKGDVWTFWTWWILAFLMGMLAMPVTGILFAGFEDKGWMFSKVLAIAVAGFLTWFLVAVKLIPFTSSDLYRSVPGMCSCMYPALSQSARRKALIVYLREKQN